MSRNLLNHLHCEVDEANVDSFSHICQLAYSDFITFYFTLYSVI